ncbi:MAG: lipopolysaccharide biosynthesis protein, partial [Flavobacterium sp.]
TISFPLSIFLFFSGEELIRVVYGNNWDEAIPVFRILSLSLSLQMILSTSGAIYQSANATKYMFLNGIINTISTVTGFLISAFFFKNIVAMAWAWDITLCLNMIISYVILYRFVLRSSLLDMSKLLAVPFVTAMSIGITLYFLGRYFQMSNLLSITCKFSLALICFFIVNQATKHYDLVKMLKLKR